MTTSAYSELQLLHAKIYCLLAKKKSRVGCCLILSFPPVLSLCCTATISGLSCSQLTSCVCVGSQLITVLRKLKWQYLTLLTGKQMSLMKCSDLKKETELTKFKKNNKTQLNTKPKMFKTMEVSTHLPFSPSSTPPLAESVAG